MIGAAGMRRKRGTSEPKAPSRANANGEERTSNRCPSNRENRARVASTPPLGVRVLSRTLYVSRFTTMTPTRKSRPVARDGNWFVAAARRRRGTYRQSESKPLLGPRVGNFARRIFTMWPRRSPGDFEESIRRRRDGAWFVLLLHASKQNYWDWFNQSTV